MLYAILAYHVEAEVTSWTPEQDAAVMTGLHQVHDRINQEGRLGPAARVGATKKARTLRGPGAGLVLDGPFAETKEQLLGFYVLDCATEEAVIEAARDLRRANPTAVYEIRPLAPLSSRRPFSEDGGCGRRSGWRGLSETHLQSLRRGLRGAMFRDSGGGESRRAFRSVYAFASLKLRRTRFALTVSAWLRHA
jgi:hypothetical protein